MVCAFCAQGIEKKLRALGHTKGVYVVLKQKVDAVELKDGQSLTHEAFAMLIKYAGYEVPAVETVEKSARDIKAEMIADQGIRGVTLATSARTLPALLTVAG